MDLQLTDKVAIITGSSKGLGLASARALVEEGCRVTICARGGGALDAAAAELARAAGRPDSVLAVTADVATATSRTLGPRRKRAPARIGLSTRMYDAIARANVRPASTIARGPLVNVANASRT